MAAPRYDYNTIARVADPNVVSSIINIGRQRGLSDDHIATALAVGIVESNLRNLNHGDLDSRGVFQQRPSQGWGSVSQVTDVAYATNTFYDRLVKAPRKQTLGLWGQSVQRSAYPDRYDAALGAARQFLSGAAPAAIAKAAGGTGKAVQGLQSKVGPGPGGQVPATAPRPSAARARVVEMITAISKMKAERAQRGEAEGVKAGLQSAGTVPGDTEATAAEALSATVRGPEEQGDQVAQALASAEGDTDWDATVAEIRALDPPESVESEANLSANAMLAPAAEDVADAEEAQLLAEAQATDAARAGAASQQGVAQAAATKTSAAAPAAAARPGGPAPSFADWKVGKRNGQIPLNQLTNLGGGHYLAPHVAASFEQMRADAARDGVNLTLTDSYRTLSAQQKLVAQKGLYSQGGLAAAPGTSGHGWGYDIDIGGGAQRTWMAQNAARYGWKTIPREPWHWQMR